MEQTTLSSTSGSSKGAKFNLFNPAFRRDPYPFFHQLRQQDPVHRYFMGKAWVLTRYQDVRAILKEKRVRSYDVPEMLQDKHQYMQDRGGELETLAFVSNKFLFFMNPPDHTRLRGLIGKSFSLSVVERMRPRIQQIVNELLEQVQGQREMDLIASLAGPLPVAVIAAMLGVPTEDRGILHEWSSVLSRILDPLVSLEEYERINKVTVKFKDYFCDLVKEKEKHPQQDLISTLITTRDQSEKLSEEELWITCILLFVTGEETTVNTIGNGMLALLQHPEQLETLKQDPETHTLGAVEEILRYDCPVQFITRVATSDLQVGERTIAAGEKLILSVGAANRDPEIFADPDKFDITRSPNEHIAFGDGIHLCLGAPLARAQAQIAIPTLLRRFPGITLATQDLKWRENLTLRGVTSLPVSL